MATEMYNTLFNHPFFTTRFNIPETFGRCLTYEAQIHCLLCLLDEVVGAAWVSPDEFNDEVTKLINMINELEKKLQDEIDTLDTKVENYYKTVNDKIDQVNNDLSTKITNLDTKVENYNKNLGDKIDNITQEFNTYKTENNNTTQQLQTDLTALTTRVTTAENNISNLITRMGSAETNITNQGARITTAEGNITNLTKTRAGITGGIYGATLASDGTLTLPTGTKIPVANLNLWSNNASPTDSDYTNALRSRAVTNGDIKGV